MSWRAGVTALIVIFAMILVWMFLAGPLIEVGESFKEFETTGQFNTETRIDNMIASWFNMILVGIFGIMVWAVWWVYRREKTRASL